LKKKRFRQTRPARILLAAGLLLLVAGIVRGEVPAVLQKAARICLECIGIG